jgi:hypothetical protein
MPSASPAASSASAAPRIKKQASPSKKGESEVEDNDAQTSGGEDTEDDAEMDDNDAQDSGGEATEDRTASDVDATLEALERESPPAQPTVPSWTWSEIVASIDSDDSDDPAQTEDIGDMGAYTGFSTWSHLVHTVDGAERVDDKVFIYFTLYVSPRPGHPASVSDFPKMPNQAFRQARPRALLDVRPQVPRKGAFPESTRPRFIDVSLLLQLIRFYEAHVPWRKAND